MNSASEQELLQMLAQLRAKHPEMRLGQLVANVAYWAKGPTKTAVWDMEDHEFLQAAREHLQRPEQK